MALQKRILLVEKQKHNEKNASPVLSSHKDVSKYLGAGFWRNLFDDSPDIIFLCDEQHRFIYCNTTTQRLLGHQEERCACMSLQDIMEEKSLALFLEAEQKIVRGGSVECDLTLHTQNGKQVSVRGTLQNLMGLTKGRFRDVTSEERAVKLQRLYLNIVDFNVSYRSIESLYKHIFEELQELFGVKHFAVVYKDSRRSKQAHVFVYNRKKARTQDKELQKYLCEVLSEEVLDRKHSLIILEKHISRDRQTTLSQGQNPLHLDRRGSALQNPRHAGRRMLLLLRKRNKIQPHRAVHYRIRRKTGRCCLGKETE